MCVRANVGMADHCECFTFSRSYSVSLTDCYSLFLASRSQLVET